jgi:hypothetical protein
MMDRPSYAVLLGQEDVWVDGSGKRHLIDEMDLRYCSNVWSFLVRSAGRIAHDLYLRMASIPVPQGEVAADDYDAITEELLTAASDKDAGTAWISRQPLTRALEERIQQLHEEAGESRTVTVTLKLKVPNGAGSDMIQRSVTQDLQSLRYDHEIIFNAD